MTGAKTVNFSPRLRGDEGIDAISVQVVPRYKTSELSGNEWRISVTVKLYLKGTVLYERRFGDVKAATAWLAWAVAGGAWAEDADTTPFDPKRYEGLCMQPGCGDVATVEYRMISSWCEQGHSHRIRGQEYRRRFCTRHSRRGDCGLDDADANYDILEGSVSEPPTHDVSQSARIDGTVSALEDLSDVIRRAKEEIRGGQK